MSRSSAISSTSNGFLFDRMVDRGALPVTRKEGDVTIVPVLEEILVTEKRIVLKGSADNAGAAGGTAAAAGHAAQ